MTTTLYDITLRISYRYESPAGANRTLLRMLPLTQGDQQLISGFVSAGPEPDFRRDGSDFFGNATTEMAHDAPLSEIDFRFTGRVRCSAGAPPLDLSCGLGQLPDELSAIRSIGPASPHHFLGDSDRVRQEPDIAAFAHDLTHPGMSTLGAVLAVSRAVHAHMSFDPKATEVTTAPVEAFRERRGVCQDFSHITIAALRAIGIPAGYASGFLRTTPPPGQKRLEGADAMHAWVQAWCGAELGWVQIDPTNDMMVGADHILVAIGRDYSDVAPVKGSLRSAGSHTTEHQVDVISVG